MIYLDDRAALQFWRAQAQPGLVRERVATVNRLRDCPTSIRDLRRQLAELPSWMTPHMMVDRPGCRPRLAGCEYTVHAGALPRGSFYQIEDGLCVASPELLFLQAARRLSVPQLTALGDELCGLYAQAKDAAGGPVGREAPLTSVARLRGFLDHAGGLFGVKRARSALPHVVEGSASPAETELAMVMALPRRHGGFGLPKPTMNYRIDFSEAARRVADASCAYADLCWPRARLDIEYDSDQWHSTREQDKHDKTRANALGIMGYSVVFVTKEQFSDAAAFEAIVEDAAKRIGCRLREPSPIDLEKRDALREILRTAKTNRYLSTTIMC